MIAQKYQKHEFAFILETVRDRAKRITCIEHRFSAHFFGIIDGHLGSHALNMIIQNFWKILKE